MSEPTSPPSLASAFRAWWVGQPRQRRIPSLFALLREFLSDSLPSRRRQRYGDVDYDWDHRVNTTAATISWRDRLLGLLHSPYQPTEPALFHEMLAQLKIDFREFVFIDIGSGKGRTLLMASDYPFHRIIGVELLPDLHRVALENVGKYKGDSQKCFAIETICGDARDFVFPREPLVVYLFNPLPEEGLRQMLGNLESSLLRHRRRVYVLYHNLVLEHVLKNCVWLKRVEGTHQYAIFVRSDVDHKQTS